MLAACSGGAPEAVNNSAEPANVAAAAPVAGQRLIVDSADLLPPDEEAALADRLARSAARTGHPLVVATLPALGGHSIDAVVEDLGNRLGMHDGVLMVVALKERQVRVAVGRDTLKLLTNGEARRIVTDSMVPDLHANRFDQGIIKGADKILSELSETSA